MTKRKPLPRLKRCVCGARAWREGLWHEDRKFFGLKDFTMQCVNLECDAFVGPVKTRLAAILAWNRMIEKPKGVKQYGL